MSNFIKEIFLKLKLRRSPYQANIYSRFMKSQKSIISNHYVDYMDKVIKNRNAFELIHEEYHAKNKELKAQASKAEKTFQGEISSNIQIIKAAQAATIEKNKLEKNEYLTWLKEQKKLNKNFRMSEKKRLREDWKSKSLEEKKQDLAKYNEELINLSFYRTNASGFWMILLCVIIECLYVVKILSVMASDYLIGVAILFNIGILLLLFTCALQVKVYKKLFSYIICGFGIYSICRLLIVPNVLKITQNLFFLGVLNVLMGIICIYVGLKSIYSIEKKEKFKAAGKISLKQMSK